MTTTLMVNPSHQGLRLWQEEWMLLNGPRVSQHQHAQNVTTMNNGDVFIWVCNPEELRGLLADIVMVDDRCWRGSYREMDEIKHILRSRMR